MTSIKKAKMTLVFVNTRSQAEMLFQALWEANDDNLPIALHHGSLDVGQRRKVEAAMAAGKLRAVVCTSTLDLGIDWGDVDLVIHVGAPKGSSRLLQRIGRSNHRLDEPAKALLVPSNRFEVLECEAALQAAKDNAQDTEYPVVLKLDVLAQHILGRACAGPFQPMSSFAEVTRAWTYRNLTREDFDKAVDYVATGGYALKAYERYAKLKPQADGSLRLAHPRIAQQYRLNIGTIVEEEMLKVRLAQRQEAPRQAPRHRRAGAWRIGGMVPAASLPSATHSCFPAKCCASKASMNSAHSPPAPNRAIRRSPPIRAASFRSRPIWPSGCARCWPIPKHGNHCRRRCATGCRLQRWKSVVPKASQMLVETFPRADKHYLVCYPFEGRLAHQTLGMLLTRRLERWGLQPLGFVASRICPGRSGRCVICR